MFKVMSRTVNSCWHVDVFDSELEARAAANHAFKTGAAQVELYRKTRDGYELIKEAKQSAKQAAESCGRWLAEGY